MTDDLDPRTAGRLARFDVLRAAATTEGDRDEAVDLAAATVVARLLAEHGPAGVVGLVAELTFEALLEYRHLAVALRDRHMEPLADMLERLWADATEETRASIDGWEADERRGAEHRARTGALTAA